MCLASLAIRTLQRLHQPTRHSKAAYADVEAALSQHLTIALQARQGSFRDMGPLQGTEVPSWSEGTKYASFHRSGAQLPAGYLSALGSALPSRGRAQCLFLVMIAAALRFRGGLKLCTGTLVQRISSKPMLTLASLLMQVEFFGNHRNMTVSASTLGLTITHRFTGHVDLNENMMGLDTFFHKDFQRELGCLTDPQPGQGCQNRRPDMLVVNSGAVCLMRLPCLYDSILVGVAQSRS